MKSQLKKLCQTEYHAKWLYHKSTFCLFDSHYFFIGMKYIELILSREVLCK